MNPSQNTLFSQDAGLQQYFSGLPAYLQETFMQSGLRPDSVEEMRSCAEHLMQHPQ